MKTLKEWYWNTKKKMIKKILIIIFINIIIISCGKKGDPVYKDKDQNSEKISTQMSAFSWFIKKVSSKLIDLILAS